MTLRPPPSLSPNGPSLKTPLLEAHPVKSRAFKYNNRERMALERLSPAPTPVDADEDAVTNGGGQTAVDGGDDGGRAPRLPRWTRQEIMVLIQGKKAAENRVRRGRVMGVGSGQVVEPKWAWVASYCKQRGVNRGPVQCRKRWSNLAGDYKKIKEWESAQAGEEAESFWVMRNDLRRERKLPGFFDREVYDILDGGGGTPAAAVTPTGLDLALAPSAVDAAEEDGKEGEEVAGEDVEAEALFDSGRSAAAEDGLFSDFEQEGAPEKEFATATGTSSLPAPIPISEKQYRPFSRVCSSQGAAAHGTQQTSNPEVGATSEEGRKRKRFAAAEGDDEETNTLQYQLIQVLERNGRMLSAQLEAQNTHLQLDREQRKGHMDGIVAALDKLAGALGRIADKL